MQTHSTWIKLGVVSLSVLLAGSYVGYRASIASKVPQPASEAPATHVFMPGPKSAPPELPAKQESPPPATQAAPVFLPGSKVDRVLPPGTELSPSFQWTPDERNTLLPGSKDAPIELLPETPKPKTKKRKVILSGSKSSPVDVEIEIDVPEDTR